VITEDSDKRAKKKDIVVPVSIIECPPIKVAGILLYRPHGYGIACCGQINAEKLDKEVLRCLPPRKKASKKECPTDNLSDVRLLVHTQPKLTGIGKKKPEFFELALGGSVEDKLKTANELLGKEIKFSDIFKPGSACDIFAVTKGKGFQGPVKRHGVAIRHHKSEKTKRGPGSLGPWMGDRTSTAPHAGQMGYHQRCSLNRYIFMIETDPAKFAPKGDFLQYGKVKNEYAVIKGTISGARKRILTMTVTRRTAKIPKDIPKVTHISVGSKQ
ncbi:50S ribosomal protein L3, partial [Candidatus Woesearchaeota archaeon]|nr:50S ribosomal protein L3 [Candidatus Woesearchaeota archaeon]